MTPEEQRIAIAEACGWLDIQRCGRSSLKPHAEGAEYRGTKDVPSVNYAREYVRLPNYLNDLNAMNEAEWTLSSEQHSAFREKLKEIQSLTAGVYRDYERAYVSAPAEDRAEAFLRTIGKWKD